MATPVPAATLPAVPRLNLLGTRRGELAELLTPIADRAFRASQIFDAIHHRGALDFDALTDLPLALRARLAERFTLALPALTARQSSADGTTKVLFRLADGATIETVEIPEPTRRTLCLSSQTGCALACTFCVTGHWGAGRDLTPAEIVGQVYALRRLPAEAEKLNLVLMGMGEPLLALGAVRPALELLAETIPWRRITVSTAGVVPGIDELARWPARPNLAVSLHAPDDARRSELMPLNRTWPLAELLASLRRFPLEPRRRLTFEYLLLAGFNDAPRDADAIARLLRGLVCKVNLIPFNPDPVLPAELAPPPEASIALFRARLARHGLTVTRRRQRGGDVAAACGQLRAARPPRRRPLPSRGGPP